MTHTLKQQPFSLGNCYMTPGIMDLVKHFQLPTHAFIARHQAGDWSKCPRKMLKKIGFQ